MRVKAGNLFWSTRMLLTMVVAVAVASSTGSLFGQATGIYRELFTGFNRADNSLAQLTNDVRFRNNTPTSTNVFNTFKTESSLGDDYGQRLRTFITAPTTGNYTFWIASDEVSQLFLSTDQNPANKRLIAFVDPRVTENNYTNFTWQQSSNIALQAGQRYYVEVIHKEANLLDHLSVRWRLPSNTIEEPIPGSRCVYEMAPVLTLQLTNLTVEEGRPVTFQTDTANFLPQRYRWQRNGADIPGATNKSYSLQNASLADNGALFRAFITNQFGATNTAEVTLAVLRDTNAPTVTAVLPANQTNLFIVFSEAMQSASALNAQNYRVGGATVQATEFGEDAKTIILTTTPLAFNFGSSVAISNLFDRASAPNALAATNIGFNIVREFNPQDVTEGPVMGGSVTVESGRSIVSGAGSGIGGTSDQFQFGWQSYGGNFDFRVQVHSLDFTDLWARAGLMARESLSVTSRFAAAFATPTLAGTFFQYRATAGEFTANAGSYPVSYPNTWLRLKRAGDLFSGFASRDGDNWTQLGNVTIAMSNRVYVGLAVTSQKTNALATAVFSDFFTVFDPTSDSVQSTSESLGPSSRKTGLVISEIMYHPRDVFVGPNKLELEFIELFNSNPFYEDISGYRLSGDIDYTFPAGTVLPGGSFFVVARVPADVQSFYGIAGVLGPFTNNLPNNAGRVRLRNDSGSVLLEVNYSSKYPWPIAADGAGHSLVLARPSYGEGQRAAWAASDAIGGSPGRLEPFGTERMRGVVINEFLAHTDAPATDFIELHNHTKQAVNVSGAYLTDDPATNKFRIPNGTTIPPFGFLSFDQNQLGFSLNSSGERIFLLNGTQTRVIDAIGFEAQANGVSSGRFPDGALAIQELTTRTPGSANTPPLVRDIVINEIMYNPISGNSDDEYVELFNKGTSTINLGGWRFTDGIDFRFPSNTFIAAGGYLVVAKNATNLFAHYTNLNFTNTVGNYDGTLANRGERLALARPELAINSDNPANITTNTIYVVADEVEYGTAGRWGQWSDGGGSSLELIDPRSDNRLAPNWADSDETAKAPWTTIETTGVLDNGGDTPDSLHTILLEEGECLLDDVEVIPSGGVNRISNFNFESGLAGWTMRGNHGRSSLETIGYNSSRSLHIRASSRGDTGPNKVYVPLTSALASGQTATIRAKVRWLHGWPEILLRLRGSYLEATDRMIVPTNLGTPGAANSRAKSNAGPAITEVLHSPAVPAENQSIVITARVSDPDGVSAVTLNYWIDPNTNNVFAVSMTDDGTGGDAIARDGIYSATIPGQPANTLIAFTVFALDGGSPAASSRFPAPRDDNGPSRECLVHCGGPAPASSFGTYRFWITQASITNWSQREVLSNERIPGTFVYGNQRVIYNAGGRYSGSSAHQDMGGPDYSPVGTPNHYAFDVPGDDLLLGTDNFNKIHGSGNNHHDDNTLVRETTAYWMARRLGLPECYKRYVMMFINGARRGSLMEDTLVPNADYIESVFPDDLEGDLFKISIWNEFGLTGQALATTGISEAYLNNYTTTGGAKKRARYRWNFQQRAVHGTANDFTNLYTLVDAVNMPAGPATTATLNGLADMEKWMRTFALEHAVGNWDCFGYRNHQNMFAYKPERGPWSPLIWDINIIFGGGTRGIPVAPDGDLFEIDTTDTGIVAIYSNPQFRRIYWQALKEISEGVLVNANADPVMDARFNAFGASGVSVSAPVAIKLWIAQRRAYIQSLLSTNDAPNFVVNGPASFSTNNNLITLSGTAPFSIKMIVVNGVSRPVVWTSVTNWLMSVPLPTTNVALTILGYDRLGNPVPGASNQIAVNYTSVVLRPQDYVVISEIHYNPTVPESSFIEIFNNSTNFTFDLSNWRLTGADFTFPEGTFITNRQFIVIAKNRAAFASVYGSTNFVTGEFSGQLDDGGETLALIAPGITPEFDVVVDKVRYDDDPPWPAEADGTGPSLQVTDLAQDNSRVGNWRGEVGWTLVSRTGDILNATNILIWLPAVGNVYIDDVSLIGPGGTNILVNGGFETDLSPAWIIPANYATSVIVSNVSHGGQRSLFLNGTANGGALTTSIRQSIESSVVTNSVYTFSFWCLANTNSVSVSARTLPGNNLSVNTVSRKILATPGAPSPFAETLPPFPPLWLNEVQPINLSGIRDGQNEREPWVELYNAGTNTVSLDGLYLTDSYANPTQWAFPSGSVIGPREFKIIWTDGEPGETSGSEWHTSFRLNGATGSVALVRIHAARPQVLDYINYAGIGADLSFGSSPDGQPFDRRIFYRVTPGTNNLAQPVSVFINEWLAGNTNGLADPADGQFDDWFELYNAGTNTVDLTGYYLSDTLTNRTKFRIPSGYVVPAGGFLLVWADEETGQNASNRLDLHVNFKLALDGEAIGLYSPETALIDEVIFGPQTNDVSQGRFADGAAAFYFMRTPTPRGPNTLGSSNTAPKIAVVITTAGKVSLTIPTNPGKTYRVEYKNDLNAAAWTPLGGNRVADSGALTIEDNIGANSQRFYRIQILDP